MTEILMSIYSQLIKLNPDSLLNREITDLYKKVFLNIILE